MPNLWDSYVSNELTGAARDSAIFGELDLESEGEGHTFKALLERLDKHTQEYVIEPESIEEMAGSWGHLHLLDGEDLDSDFTTKFDELEAKDQSGLLAKQKIAWQEGVIADICKQLAQAPDMTAASQILYEARKEYHNPDIILAVDKQYWAKYAAIKGLISLKVDYFICDMRQMLVHSALNKYVTEAKKVLLGLQALYGLDITADLAELERESRKAHQSIAAHIEASRQEQLKAFSALTLRDPITMGSEMAFTPQRAQTLQRQGWQVVPSVNTCSHLGL